MITCILCAIGLIFCLVVWACKRSAHYDAICHPVSEQAEALQYLKCPPHEVGFGEDRCRKCGGFV
jgi:hypothetical protein